MDAAFSFFALIGVVFYGFIIWAVLSHVKEMRRQSAVLSKIADLIERSQGDK